MLVSKTKPCMSKYKPLHGETATCGFVNLKTSNWGKYTEEELLATDQ